MLKPKGEERLKLLGCYDVIVVGGGTAGVHAAIAAARNGAITLLIERYGQLGGQGTGGLLTFVNAYHNVRGEQVVGGTAHEMIERLKKIGGTQGHLSDYTGMAGGTVTVVNCTLLEFVQFDMVEESGAQLLLHTWFSEAVVENNTVKGVRVFNKSGSQLILGSVIVDCTGDADIAVSAGALVDQTDIDMKQPVTLEFRVGGVDNTRLMEFVMKNPTEFKLQIPPKDLPKQRYQGYSLSNFAPLKEAVEKGLLPKGLTHKQLWFAGHQPDMQRGIFTFNATRIAEIDGTDACHLTRAEVEARKQMLPLIRFLNDNLPGFENAFLLNIAPQIGVRDTRRIKGEYTLTRTDVINGVRFDDRIGRFVSQIDIHRSDKEKSEFYWVRAEENTAAGYDFDIPYRSLIPQGVDGLIVAGRAISATREAHGAVRFMPACMVTGQAAGTAAALASQSGSHPRSVDVEKLQTLLSEQGAIL